MKNLIFLITLFVFTMNSQVLFGQDEQFRKQLEEIMKAREEMLKTLMDDSSFGSLDRKMEEMMKRLSQSGLINDFGFDQLESEILGQSDWEVSDTHKILRIKVQQIKDRPLDIKIEKGMINIKGQIESVSGQGKNSVKRVTNFQRSFSLPTDIDQTNPEFENKEGEVLIKFKKLSKTNSIKKPKVLEQPERQPISAQESELTI